MSAGRGKRIASPDNTLRIALSLARAGWPVFPVSIYGDESGKRHKVPAVPRGTSWVDWATTDAEKITTAWTGEQAGSWIGVYCGGAMLVVGDVDLEPVDGRKSLKACGLKFPPTLSYKTLGGGRHYIYRAPEGMALTNAQGLIYQGKRIEGVDVRGGQGLMVYYGPELHPIADARYDSHNPDAVKAYSERKRDDLGLAEAPEWLLVPATPKAADRAPSADETALRDRLVPGKPKKKTRKLVAGVDFPSGAAHKPMLEVVTALVTLGARGEPGIADLIDETRERYVGDHPDRARDWDNAIAGSVKRLGLPPVTLELAEVEKKAIVERNDPKAVAATEAAREVVLTEKKAERISAKIILGDGQLTDAALAEAIAERLTGHWANAQGIGLLRYTGKVWKEADEVALIETVRKMLRRIRADETRAAILRGDKRHEDEAKMLEGRSRVVNIARFVAGILAELTGPLDSHPDLLNVQNGVVDLRTKKLMPHDPEYLFTKIAGTVYEPKADDTLWRTALKALPKDSREWMQFRMGQALTGYTPDDAVMPILEGGGENGKGTKLDAIRGAFGDYAITVSDRLLLANPNDHPTELTELMGARLAVAEEMPEGRNLNVKRLKDVLGTATLTARRMRENNVTWKATHAIVVATNYRLNVAETDHGTWRRLALVLFPYRFVKRVEDIETPRDRLGDSRLKQHFERNADPAVLAWLIEGAAAWYENGRKMPAPSERIRRDTEEWRSEADPVMGYVAEKLELAEGYAIASSDLTADFNAYLEQRSNRPWAESTIGSRFRDHVMLPGVEKRQVRFGAILPSRPPFTVRTLPAATKAWVGVKFRTEPDRLTSEAERDAADLADLERRIGD